MSTHFRTKYSRDRLLPVIDGNPDFLDTRMAELLNSFQSYNIHTFREGEHLPNIAKRYHGTTTTYWIIASYNGVIHPLDIEPGTILRIPRLQDIDQYLNLVNSRIGETVTI